MATFLIRSIAWFSAQSAFWLLKRRVSLSLSLSLSLFFQYLFIYLAALGLSCGPRDLLVAAWGIFSWGMLTFSCSMRDLVPYQGSNLGSLHWGRGVLAAGPPGKSEESLFKYCHNRPVPFTLFWVESPLLWLWFSSFITLMTQQHTSSQVLSLPPSLYLSKPRDVA